MMEVIWKVILLGILQGVLEWLPISSQGNLVLVMIYLLGIDQAEALNLSVYLHIGTFFAALTYFRYDFLTLAKNLPSYRFQFGNGVNSLVSFLLFSSILSGFVGYFIIRLAEISLSVGEYFTGMMGVALLVTGVLQKYSTKTGRREIEDVKPSDTFLLGIAQGFSAFPGISRSGITIFALLLRKFKNEAAIKLSFLMSVPAVIGAGLGLGLGRSFVSVGTIGLLVGCLSSFLTGLPSIRIMMKTAQKVNFWSFCVFIGSLALLPTFSNILATLS